MEKKNVKDKRLLRIYLFTCLCLLLIMAAITRYEYNKYVNNNNDAIVRIIDCIKDKYPDVTDKEILNIVDDNSSPEANLFEKYGILKESDSIVDSNRSFYIKCLVINLGVVIIFALIVLLMIFLRNKSRDKEIKQIINYIEEINRKNYKLEIDDLSEDELSILKNEIYKTTIMLKENAENSISDKIELKKSLEDISHQIKTPLTSILVMLDNLIDDPDMDPEVRLDFVMDIKRNINNINFLIQVLLKLSKFDSNTIKFIKGEYKIKNIVDEAVRNVESLCDLKNISLCITGDEEVSITCDKKWQIEAITNIVKNCVEHSFDDSKIDISYEESNVYAEIIIRDYGEGISEKDLPHIFERFFKSSASKSDSFGIGLALAKKIIESDKGNISVDRMDVGTKFSIKYFKI
ncbi:sensor histidine kinase KdpD [Eubacterium sp.]|uniref:sensor histidine kinase n=1 Tax=Eubacterium sp. TaxID=142586 RepID=UPI00259A96C6|nr:HAMP domain-containing sensor histidine kinase [Eubacterium sp.]MCR5628582.1 HAMP domain-containing histidine kinase [Eubacterium sp.]